MDEQKKSTDKLVWFLKERAKELNCLYKIEEHLNDPDKDIGEICKGIIDVIPPGWQYPDICQAKITLNGVTYKSSNFRETEWVQMANIIVLDDVIGTLWVYYIMEMPAADFGPFLKEETKLIGTIAERLGNFIAHQKMRRVFDEYKNAAQDLIDKSKPEWRIILDLLRETDRSLFLRISHKMLNHLCWNGIEDAKGLMRYYSPDARPGEEGQSSQENKPFQKKVLISSNDFLSDETFKIATDNLPSEEILGYIQKWIQQDKLNFLVKSLVNLNASMSEVADAVRRYQRMTPEGIDIPNPIREGVLVSLIRRFFSDQLDFINVAKNYVGIGDFYNLIQNVIYTDDSHGKLGGKSAGLFIAMQILRKCGDPGMLANLKTPKTWYISSDLLIYFMHHNNFEEVIEQKYKDINQVRVEYPHIVQTFKNAHFPPEFVKGVSMALDDFKDNPLIVRSSSLLEDRTGAAFSGKYKSLFIANQGSKEERLEAVLDAISEVYASTFGPDPIGYRIERGLLDFHEEMGIMIQEVVGTKAGKYFLPAYAGVAFSKNDFRWSPRIKRDDGLVRLVPGLGTRAVDRLSDDYPVLMSPGQPGLRVNVTPEESIRYSPRKIDVINLETNTFETIDIGVLLKNCEDEYPALKQIFSINQDRHISEISGLALDFVHTEFIATFNGLIAKTYFVNTIQSILKILEEKMGVPVDIEFASDGRDFYLLQCRPQSHSEESIGAAIPNDVPEDRMIFTARKFVSNGRVPEITHIVYIDDQKYSEIGDRGTLLEVGRAVGRLNMLLPKRQFILIGPGRWGSRGDIKLGVNVTYSDINNTAVLIEVARKRGNYVPDLSFGTHFFQDLVEARIRYLPLYPDDAGIVFNERFLKNTPNVLTEILPQYGYLSDTIRVIDVPRSSNGRILQILMNADLDEAVALLVQPDLGIAAPIQLKNNVEHSADHHWRWRMRMIEHIASQIDPARFGVKGFYVFGSTKNGTAGPGSDIDILVHFKGTKKQQESLSLWLEGWSLCLGELNYLQTGYKSDGLLDIHIITDDDIAHRNSYAIKIGAVTDAARSLPLMKKDKS